MIGLNASRLFGSKYPILLAIVIVAMSFLNMDFYRVGCRFRLLVFKMLTMVTHHFFFFCNLVSHSKHAHWIVLVVVFVLNSIYYPFKVVWVLPLGYSHHVLTLFVLPCRIFIMKVPCSAKKKTNILCLIAYEKKLIRLSYVI